MDKQNPKHGSVRSTGPELVVSNEGDIAPEVGSAPQDIAHVQSEQVEGAHSREEEYCWDAPSQVDEEGSLEDIETGMLESMVSKLSCSLREEEKVIPLEEMALKDTFAAFVQSKWEERKEITEKRRRLLLCTRKTTDALMMKVSLLHEEKEKSAQDELRMIGLEGVEGRFEAYRLEMEDHLKKISEGRDKLKQEFELMEEEKRTLSEKNSSLTTEYGKLQGINGTLREELKIAKAGSDKLSEEVTATAADLLLSKGEVRYLTSQFEKSEKNVQFTMDKMRGMAGASAKIIHRIWLSNGKKLNLGRFNNRARDSINMMINTEQVKLDAEIKARLARGEGPSGGGSTPSTDTTSFAPK